MPVITDIRQVRQKGFVLYVDGKRCCQLGKEDIRLHQLEKDRELTEDELDQIQISCLYKRLLDYSIRLLASQNRTRAEISRKLRVRTTSLPLINLILQKLDEYKYIESDEQYMKRTLESRGGYGSLYFIKKFAEKGISLTRIKEFLTVHFGRENERVAALELLKEVSKKFEKLKDPFKAKKLVQVLKNRGFRNEIIYSSIKGIESEDFPES